MKIDGNNVLTATTLTLMVTTTHTCRLSTVCCWHTILDPELGYAQKMIDLMSPIIITMDESVVGGRAGTSQPTFNGWWRKCCRRRVYGLSSAAREGSVLPAPAPTCVS
jgi:hypothetical protein